MAICGRCGANVAEGVPVCPACGNPMAAPQQPTRPTGGQGGFSEKFSAVNNTPDTTAQFERADIEQNKVMAILAYLSWLVLIPIFAAPRSKFARFHANQGLVLAITEIIFGIAYYILSMVIFSISWRLGFLVSIIGLVGIVFLVLSILGIVNAVNGKAKELPVIGKFKLLK